jgi:hypothetical protein
MRDPKQIVLASLAYAKEQRTRSWWHFLSTMVVLFALAAAISFGDQWWLRIPASIVMGLVLVRVFIIYHDFQHGTILKGSRFAKPVARLRVAGAEPAEHLVAFARAPSPQRRQDLRLEHRLVSGDDESGRVGEGDGGRTPPVPCSSGTRW